MLVTDSKTKESQNPSPAPPAKNHIPSSPRGVVQGRDKGQGASHPLLEYVVATRAQPPTTKGGPDRFVAVIGVPDGKTFDILKTPVNADKLRKQGYEVMFVGEGWAGPSVTQASLRHLLVQAHSMAKQMNSPEFRAKQKQLVEQKEKRPKGGK